MQEAPVESGSTSAEVAEEQTEETEATEETTEPGAADVSGRLKMTLNGTDVVYAELTDTTATAEFLEQLPFTVDMHEHLDRQKEVYLPFSLSEESQQDTPVADDFAEQLPLTLDMTDYAEREKHAHLDFTIDDSDLENIQYPYEIGDIIYYPPGPTFAMYYDHDGREISAGMEVIARLDEEGIVILGSYEDAVKVTVELSN